MRGPLFVAESPNVAQHYGSRGFQFLMPPGATLDDAVLERVFARSRRIPGEGIAEVIRRVGANYLSVTTAVRRADVLDRCQADQTLVLLGVRTAALSVERREGLFAELETLLSGMNDAVLSHDWDRVRRHGMVCEWEVLSDWMRRLAFTGLPSAEVTADRPKKPRRWAPVLAAVAMLIALAALAWVYFPRPGERASGPDTAREPSFVKRDSTSLAIPAVTWVDEAIEFCRINPERTNQYGKGLEARRRDDLEGSLTTGRNLLAMSRGGSGNNVAMAADLTARIQAIERTLKQRREATQQQVARLRSDLAKRYGDLNGSGTLVAALGQCRQELDRPIEHIDEYPEHRKEVEALREYHAQQVKSLAEVDRVAQLNGFPGAVGRAMKLRDQSLADLRVKDSVFAEYVWNRWLIVERGTNFAGAEKTGWAAVNWSELDSADDYESQLRDALKLAPEVDRELRKKLNLPATPENRVASTAEASASKFLAECKTAHEEANRVCERLGKVENLTAWQSIETNHAKIREAWAAATNAIDRAAAIDPTAESKLSEAQRAKFQAIKEWARKDPFAPRENNCQVWIAVERWPQRLDSFRFTHTPLTKTVKGPLVAVRSPKEIEPKERKQFLAPLSLASCDAVWTRIEYRDGLRTEFADVVWLPNPATDQPNFSQNLKLSWSQGGKPILTVDQPATRMTLPAWPLP